MEKRACGSCGREGQRSGQSYGRLLYLTHGAIKSIPRPPTRPSSSDMQTYSSKPVSIFCSNTAKPSRRAARRLASSKRRVWSSCVKVTLDKQSSAIGLAHEDRHKALLGCCCRRSAADVKKKQPAAVFLLRHPSLSQKPHLMLLPACLQRLACPYSPTRAWWATLGERVVPR